MDEVLDSIGWIEPAADSETRAPQENQMERTASFSIPNQQTALPDFGGPVEGSSLSPAAPLEGKEAPMLLSSSPYETHEIMTEAEKQAAGKVSSQTYIHTPATMYRDYLEWAQHILGAPCAKISIHVWG